VDESRQIIDKWRSQSRKGFLDLCVLALLNMREKGYGLDIMEALNAAGLDVAEGTLYPLLTRMTREGSLEATWTTPDTGHPRKYYRLTALGREAFAAMQDEFEKEVAAYRRLAPAAAPIYSKEEEQ